MHAYQSMRVGIVWAGTVCTYIQRPSDKYWCTPTRACRPLVWGWCRKTKSPSKQVRVDVVGGLSRTRIAVYPPYFTFWGSSVRLGGVRWCGPATCSHHGLKCVAGVTTSTVHTSSIKPHELVAKFPCRFLSPLDAAY